MTAPTTPRETQTVEITMWQWVILSCLIGLSAGHACVISSKLGEIKTAIERAEKGQGR